MKLENVTLLAEWTTWDDDTLITALWVLLVFEIVGGLFFIGIGAAAILTQFQAHMLNLFLVFTVGIVMLYHALARYMIIHHNKKLEQLSTE